MKYASLMYSTSNIGDNFQTIAAEQHLPVINKKVNRDNLNQVVESDRFVLIMNGWYTHIPENWPPSESIIPVFIGFHIAENNRVQELLLNDNILEKLSPKSSDLYIDVTAPLNDSFTSAYISLVSALMIVRLIYSQFNEMSNPSLSFNIKPSLSE